MAKIYTFPTASKHTSSASWLHRVLCALVYLAVAYVSATGFSFWLFVILGLTYYATVYLRRWQWASSNSFTRYHLLQAILLFFMASMLGQLLGVLLNTGVAMLAVLQHLPVLGTVFASPINVARWPWLWMQLTYLLGIFSFIMALLGKEHRFPLVSAVVDRYQWR
jgi:uncharacterized membrane protein